MLRAADLVDEQERQVRIVTKTRTAIFDLASIDLGPERDRGPVRSLTEHRQKRAVAAAVIEKRRRAQAPYNTQRHLIASPVTPCDERVAAEELLAREVASADRIGATYQRRIHVGF